jgi:tRNA dimethylallyltransferase
MIRTVFVLVGPTASGKTDAACSLAERFPLEVINADSLQIFRRLDIGSAKPTKEMRDSVPHHLIDQLDPDAEATAAWYAKEAAEAIRGVQRRKRIPLVVGGSGFYLRAMERPPKAPETAVDPSSVSSEDYALVKEQDPEAARRIHPNDRYRIARAVSLLRKGVRPSQQWSETGVQAPLFSTCWFGIQRERSAIHQRIESRVRWMFDHGLVEETRGVLQDFPNARTRLSRAIGYRQTLDLVEGRGRLPEAIEKAIFATRQYAKRQMTWFRKEARIRWFDPETDLPKIGAEVEKELDG